MRFAMRFIVLCWLIGSPAASLASPADRCGECHGTVRRSGGHASLTCTRCHGAKGDRRFRGADAARDGCTPAGCHAGYLPVLHGPMATRAPEKAFAARTIGRYDPAFFGKACAGCHVSGCADCHEGGGHAAAKPPVGKCLRCHSGDFIGAEYLGLAPREENARFARGISRDGEYYLKMLPDVHAEAGMACGACHSMQSLAEGRRSSRGCTDCHEASVKIVEHSISSHLSGMTCSACHSAWAAQPYGTFYLRIDGIVDAKSRFDLRHEKGGYMKSVYLHRQDAPPLGIDGQGKVSPILPRFILYYSDVRPGMKDRVENRLLAAEWKTIFPHTVRRGSVTCEGCHDAPDRWMREPAADRIFRLKDDGLSLAAFRDREGQRVINGAFLDEGRIARLKSRNREYKIALVNKWKRLIDRVDGSLGR
ncbi:MAG TPA: selenite/tellurite reduction operon b-type cytochrome iron-sulfur cluster-binding subunit ExtO [Candidatus Deferrimicrobiaceae bacterium]